MNDKILVLGLQSFSNFYNLTRLLTILQVFPNLVIVLESLAVVLLDVESSRYLITRLGSHALVFSLVESMKRQLLRFLEILLEEKVVAEVVQNHRILAVDAVCFRKSLNTHLDALWLALVQLQHLTSYQ